ncbi:MAG TPA: HlyD family secretion protein [Verrucomicrobiae bacterium]|nr:HlyD family secretion protein [Verrucomicrobiae bacterium]
MTSAVLDGTGVAIPTAARKRSRPRHLGLAAAALLLAAAAAWYGHDWWTVGRFIESTDDAYVGGDITVIAPKVAGFIAEVAVTDNQAVHAGDLLVKLDDRDYKAALARATAAVAGQQATLANLDARRQLQQAMIAQAQAELAATAAEIARAKYDVDRYRSLIQGQYASLQRFQQADADYKKATAADQKARAAVTAAERELDVIDTQKQQTQADLAAAIADRDTAQLNLSYTELRAPIDGVIGNRSARRGAFAPVGAQLISLVPAEGLWIDANFKESQLARMQPGLPVRIEADVLPGEVFIGHVGSLAPATGAEFSILPPENATGNFTKIVQRVPVRILLDGDAARLGRLRPGLSVTVAFDERGEGTRAP